ncbi:MAG TPA: hypothetical protein VNE62_08020 [Actinomycetota bacterium]|nr:hypothetical protein [Actinomycetota bacterium]
MTLRDYLVQLGYMMVAGGVLLAVRAFATGGFDKPPEPSPDDWDD